MLRALLLAVAFLGTVVHGRQIQHHGPAAFARVVHRMLQQVAPSPQSSPGSASWQYGTCNVVLQDADLVVLPPSKGNTDGNLANQPAADVSSCCASCQKSYKQWEAANLATVNNAESNPVKAMEAIIKMKDYCGGWTFVPGPPGGNGTCYLKNALNVKFYRDLLAAIKTNKMSKVNDALARNANETFFTWYIEERPTTRGWFSGTLPNPSIKADGWTSYFFEEFVRENITVLYSEPLAPSATSACTTSTEKAAWICKKLLGKVKTNSISLATTG